MFKQLEIDFGVTEEQACIMCHLSSECGGCCVKCKADGRNGTCYGQNCSQENKESQTSRWKSWMYLVATTLPELKRFVPKKYHNELKKYKKQEEFVSSM